MFDGFEEDVANDGQALGGDFVHGVLGSVPVIGGGIEGDYVGGRDVALEEGVVVVGDGGGFVDEVLAVAETSGGGPDYVDQGLGGIGLAFDAEILAADDVGEEERANFFEVAAVGETSGHLAAAEAIARIFPLWTNRRRRRKRSIWRSGRVGRAIGAQLDMTAVEEPVVSTNEIVARLVS